MERRSYTELSRLILTLALVSPHQSLAIFPYSLQTVVFTCSMG